jgi:hypothetical protein
MLKSDNYNIYDINNIVNKHISNTKKIYELENKLKNYRFTSGNEFLNVLNRKNIERNIQKRNSIIKEINSLTYDNEILYHKLLDFYELLYADLSNAYNNETFRFVLDYVDDLKIEFFNKIVFLDKSEVESLFNEKKLDLLQYKRDIQSKILDDLDVLIRKLKLKQNFYKNLENNQLNVELSDKIDKLNKIYDNLKLSQDYILNFIN